MSLTAIGLCSKALMRLGASTISSFDECTAEAEVCATLYPMVRDALLSSYPWSFATAQERLPMLNITPVTDFAYSYALPIDLLRIISAGRSGRGRGVDYRIVQDTLHTNSSEVYLTYIFRPEEDYFPAFFTQALIAKLSMEFALPLTDSSSKAEMLGRAAEDEIRKARLIDSQQATVKALEHFPLIDARN